MPDDDVKPTDTETVDETKVEDTVEETVDDTKVDETVEDPHPLDPGGKRFSEVYGEMKDARREAQDLRERLAKLEGHVQAVTKPEKPADQFYSAEQLQAMVDAGRISPAKMADQLSWQRGEMVKREMTQQRVVEDRRKDALSEVNQYVDKLPNLLNPSSSEFTRVARAAREIASDMDRTVDDPVVQRRALRETFGSLDKLTKAASVRESSRVNADTHAETRGSGGVGGVNKGPGKDPLKDVPQHYKDHWKRLGYTPEQMAQEAGYIRPRRR